MQKQKSSSIFDWFEFSSFMGETVPSLSSLDLYIPDESTFSVNKEQKVEFSLSQRITSPSIFNRRKQKKVSFSEIEIR